MSQVANLSIKIGADIKNATKGLNDVQKKMQNVSKKMGDIGKDLTKKVSLPIAGVFAGFAKSAMDLEATEAKYNTVFGEMTDTSDAFIKDFQKLTPATTAEARSMASGIQDLLIPMGFAREEATDTTGELMHLTGALANFNSGTHTATDVSNAFQSALLGQYQPLASLGIQLSKTEVEQRALEMGLAATNDELTKADLALAMTELAYEQSGDALEAYTEENLDAKTKMGLMKAEAIDVAAEFGAQLLPMINRLIESVRGLIDWFSGLSEEQQRQIMMVMAVVAAIGPLLIIISKVIGAISGIIGVFAALNPLTLLIIGVITLLTGAFVMLWRENETFRDKVLEIWELVKTSISTAVENIRSAIETFIAVVTAFWDKWGEDILSTAMTIFSAVYTFISTTIEQVRSIIESVIGLIMAIWNRWGADITRITTDTFNGILRTIEIIWGVITQVIDGAMDIIRGVIEVATGLISGDWAKVWGGMEDVVKGAANVIGGLVNGIISAVEQMVNAVGRAINRMPSFDIPDWVPVVGGKSFGMPNIPTVSLPRVPSLDVGTDKVLSDGLAMIHEGESIVPADVAGGGFNGSNNAENILNKILHAIETSNNGTIHIENIENKSDSDIPRILEKSAWLMNRQEGRLSV